MPPRSRKKHTQAVRQVVATEPPSTSSLPRVELTMPTDGHTFAQTVPAAINVSVYPPNLRPMLHFKDFSWSHCILDDAQTVWIFRYLIDRHLYCNITSLQWEELTQAFNLAFQTSYSRKLIRHHAMRLVLPQFITLIEDEAAIEQICHTRVYPHLVVLATYYSGVLLHSAIKEGAFHALNLHRPLFPDPMFEFALETGYVSPARRDVTADGNIVFKDASQGPPTVIMNKSVHALPHLSVWGESAVTALPLNSTAASLALAAITGRTTPALNMSDAGAAALRKLTEVSRALGCPEYALAANPTVNTTGANGNDKDRVRTLLCTFSPSFLMANVDKYGSFAPFAAAAMRQLADGRDPFPAHDFHRGWAAAPMFWDECPFATYSPAPAAALMSPWGAWRDRVCELYRYGNTAPQPLQTQPALTLAPGDLKVGIPTPAHTFDCCGVLPALPPTASLPQAPLLAQAAASASGAAQPLPRPSAGMYGTGTYQDSHWRNAGAPLPGYCPGLQDSAASKSKKNKGSAASNVAPLSCEKQGLDLLVNRNVVLADGTLTPVAQKTLFILQQRLALYWLRRALNRMAVHMVQPGAVLFHCSLRSIPLSELHTLHTLLHSPSPNALAAKILACRGLKGETQPLVAGNTVKAWVQMNLLTKLSDAYPRNMLSVQRSVHALLRPYQVLAILRAGRQQLTTFKPWMPNAARVASILREWCRRLPSLRAQTRTPDQPILLRGYWPLTAQAQADLCAEERQSFEMALPPGMLQFVGGGSATVPMAVLQALLGARFADDMDDMDGMDDMDDDMMDDDDIHYYHDRRWGGRWG